MKDIREEIGERLSVVEQSIGDLESRLEQLREEEATLRKMLEMENRRFHSGIVSQTYRLRTPSSGFFGNNIVTSEDAAHRKPLMEYVLDMLEDGNIRSLEHIRDKAIDDGYLSRSDDSVSPGRAIQGCLINLKKRGLVDNVAKGRWRKAKNAPADKSAGASLF